MTQAHPASDIDSERDNTPPAAPVKSRNLGVLRAMLDFLRPYRLQVLGASIALVLTAGITLSIGQGLRLLVDRGFASGANPQMLNQSLLLFAVMILLLAIGTFTRFLSGVLDRRARQCGSAQSGVCPRGRPSPRLF